MHSPFISYKLPTTQGAWRPSPSKCFLFPKLGRGREGNWDAAGVVVRITGFSETVKWEPRHSRARFPSKLIRNLTGFGGGGHRPPFLPTLAVEGDDPRRQDRDQPSLISP